MSYLYRENLVPLCIPGWRSMWPFYGLLLGEKKIKIVFNLTLQPQGEIQAKSRSSHSDERSTYNLWSGESGCRGVQQDDPNSTSSIALAPATWLVELGTSCLEHVVCQADVPIQMFSPECLFPPRTPSKQLVNGLAFQEKKCFSCLASQSRKSNFGLVGVCIMSCFRLIFLSPHPASMIACELRWVK